MAKYRLQTVDGRTLRTGSYSESEVIKALGVCGYAVYKRGWPDLLAVKGDSVRFIEVKPHCDSHLTGHQQQVKKIFRAKGVEVEVWCPEGQIHD